MKWIVSAIIIGLVGGMLDEFTNLHKFWCFFIGVGTLLLGLFVKSIITMTRIMRQTKGKKKLWIDQNNNVVESE